MEKLHPLQLALCSLVNPFPAAPPCLGKYLPGEKLCSFNPILPQFPCKGFVGLGVAVGAGRDLLAVPNSRFWVCHLFCYVTKWK